MKFTRSTSYKKNIIIVLIILFLTISSTASIYNSSEQPGYADWPTFQRDTNHTGHYVGDLNKISTIINFWNYSIPGFVNGGLNSVISNGVAFFGNANGKVYAIDLYTGVKKWEHDADAAINSGFAIADGRVFGGDTSGDFFSLDEETGVELCNFSLTGYIESNSPTIYEGIVAVTETGNKMRLINVTDCSEICSYTLSAASYQSPSIAADIDGDVLVYTASSGNQMIGVYLTNCSAKWTTTGGTDVKANTFSDNVVYFGADNNLLAKYANNGSVFCSHNMGATLSTGLSVSENYLFASAGSSTKRIYKNNCTVDWIKTRGQTVTNGVIAINKTSIIFGNSGGVIDILNYSTGEPLWNWSGAGGNFRGIAIGNGIIVAANQNYNFYAFAESEQVTSISSSSSSSSSSSIIQSSSSSSSLIESSSSSSSSTSTSSSSSLISSSSSSSIIESSSSSSSSTSTSSSSSSSIIESSISSSSSSSSIIESSSSSSSSSIIESSISSSSSSSSIIENSISSSSSSSSVLESSSSSSSTSTSSSSTSSSSSSSSIPTTTIPISWGITETESFDEPFATTTTLREIYEEYAANTTVWADCDAADIGIAERLGCYLSAVSSEFMNSANSLSESIINLSESITDGIAAIPGALQEAAAEQFYGFVEAYGFTRQVIQNIFTFIFTLIWWFWGICLVITAFFWGGIFALFLLMESLFIIMAFGKKSRNPWDQLKQFVEYQLHMGYFVFRVIKKTYDLIYSVFSLIRGGGTTGT